MDRIRRLAADVQRRVDARALRHAAPAAPAAVQPARVRPGRAGPGVQYRGVVYDEHELAGVLRRIDHELFHADGRPGLSQLRVGGGGHLRRYRIHPRHRPERKGHARQLLGGHGKSDPVGAAADRDRRRALPRLPGRGPEPQALRHGADGRGRQAGDRAGARRIAGNHQAVRHERRRLLQCEQLTSVREPDAAHELPGDVRHLRHLVRPHLYPWHA